MKSTLASRCFALALWLLPLLPFVSQAADGDRQRSHLVKDSLITAKVKARLSADKLRNLANIKVDTDSDGVVRLSGNVASQSEEERAIAIARETEGVTEVRSDIRLGKD